MYLDLIYSTKAIEISDAKDEYNEWFFIKKYITTIEYNYTTADISYHDKRHIQNHLYNLTESAAKEALKPSDFYSFYSLYKLDNLSNYIQLSRCAPDSTKSNHRISKEDYKNRILFHLRLSKNNQLTLTLNYFSRRNIITQLKQNNLALYLKANIFEPGLLINALKKDTTFITQFDNFIAQGLRAFSQSNGLFSHNSLFLVQLKNLVFSYAALMDPQNSNYVGKLSSFQNKLLEQIRKHNDPNILSTLHREYFLNTSILLQVNAANDEMILNAFKSYLYTQAIQNIYIEYDTVSNDEFEKHAIYLNESFRNITSEHLEIICNDTLKDLKVDISECQFIGTYPRFTYQDAEGHSKYTINLEQGKIYQDGKSLSYIPLSLKGSILLQKLNINQSWLCWISEDKHTFQFKDYNIRIKQNGNKFIVQKQFTISNEKQKWYQLQATSESQAQLYNIEQTASKLIPKILQDGSIELWVSVDDALLFLFDKPLYRIDSAGVFYQLDDLGHSTHVLSKLNNQYTHELMKFENKDYTLVNKNGMFGTISFPRYNLTLNILNNQIYLPNSNYYLKTTHESSFLADIACLHFSNDDDDLYLIAIQPFYLEPSNNFFIGTEPALTHDTNSHILESQLKQNEINYYYNTEKYIAIHSRNGIIKTNSTADALYCCYLYLAKHNTHKALEILNKIEQGLMTLEGNKQELTYVFWIMHGLPIKYDQIGKEIILQFGNKPPEYIACQLKAMSLLTDFLALNTLSPLNDTSHSIKDERWIKYLQKFSSHENLSDNILQLIDLYQNSKRHLEESFILKDQALENLLQYCDEHCLNHNRIKHGYIGFMRMQLSLKKLIKEYHHLLALKQSLTTIPQNLEQQIEKIKQVVSEETTVMKHQTKIEWELFNPVFPEKINKLFDINSNQFYSCYEYTNRNIPELQDLTSLNSDISLQQLIDNFNSYLQICRSDNTYAKQTLNKFCEQVLKTFPNDLEQLTAAAPMGEDPNKTYLNEKINIYYIVNVIYHIAQNIELYDSNSADLRMQYIIDKVQKYSVTPILRANIKDVFEEVLSTNKALWDEFNNTIIPKKPLLKLREIYPTSLCQTLNMVACMQDYIDEELNYKTELKQLIQEKDPITLKTNDIIAGRLQYRCVLKQRELAEKIFGDKNVRDTLMHKLEEHQISDDDVEHFWDEIIEFANNNLAREKSLQLLAKQKHTLTKEELISLYLKADLTLYLETTRLSEQDCCKLHEKIHQIISISVRQQHITNLINTIIAYEEKPESSHLQKMANILVTENLPQAQCCPHLMVMQYYDKILLRPRQVEVLETLLPNENEPLQTQNIVEQVIMGGGKSKVILPLLAKKKTTGLNFVIIEVPRSMLATNHADLAETSSRLFHQKAIKFEFNRNSDCSPQRLKTIYEKFTSIIVNQDYLVTTGESMQSLQLKYLELLDNYPQSYDEQKIWTEQIYWASKIVSLLKDRGDAISDEMHQGFLLKKKLNYSIGSQEHVSPQLIDNHIELYKFCSDSNIPYISLNDLIENPQSPLQPIIQNLQSTYPEQDLKTEIANYLQNQYMPEVMAKIDPNTRDTLAFYKKQLQLMPYTTNKHYKEEYGPSEAASSAVANALAIPYLSANQPNERSRFGNSLETINYTIQGLLINGLNAELLQTLIQYWQEIAEKQFLNSLTQYETREETPMAQHIAKLFADKHLTLTDLSSPEYSIHGEKLQDLLNQVRHDSHLIYEILREKILPQVSIEPNILHSNSSNHADLYHSIQGLSATPWNSDTFHTSIKFNLRQSLGTDGYTLSVLENKQPEIKRLPITTKTDELIQYLVSQPGNNRAIIDICAQFAGEHNIDIAKLIAHHCREQQDIKWILYFNKNNILCALNTQSLQSIELRASNSQEIDERLGCTANQRWTYYDHGHTEAADLRQTHNANALVLVDHRTYIKSFLQGSMRMRELDKEQTISIFVPHKEPNNYEELVDLMQNNQQVKLQEDLFYATIDHMNNVIREDFLKRLALIPDSKAEEKYNFYQKVKSYLIEQKSHSLFDQFGGIYQEQDTEFLLDKHKQKILQDWQKILNTIQQSISANEVTEISKQLNTIIQKSLPLCQEKTLSFAQNPQALSTEVEVEKELLKEIENEKETENELYDHELDADKVHHWSQSNTSAISPWEQFIESGENNIIHTLNNKSQTTYYSKELFVEDNFSQVFIGQQQMIGPYLKPVFSILFRQQGESISACIVDVNSLYELHTLMNTTENSTNIKIWISTTQHHILHGSFPENILQNTQYLSLIEQIRFFNGEFDLLKQQTVFHWLSEDKLEHFRTSLLRYRPTDNEDYESFVQYFKAEAKCVNYSLVNTLGIFQSPEDPVVNEQPNFKLDK